MPRTTSAPSPGLAHLSGARLSSPFNYRVDDWTILTGASVEIRKDGTAVRRGRVEDTTPDGCILWLSGGQGEPRRLFEKTEGFHVWACSEQTPLLYEAGRSRPR
jgi:hypothetical protein